MDDATKRVAAAAKAAKAKGSQGYRVAIIGAGASGLCAAIKLVQAGVEVVVLERNTTVGGVWGQVNSSNHVLFSFFFSFNFSKANVNGDLL